MQENGWEVVVVKAVVTRAGRTVVSDVDSDTNPLVPILGLADAQGRVEVLWRKASGICCPSAVTLRLSRIDQSGKLVFGKAFTAGGQPCDR